MQSFAWLCIAQGGVTKYYYGKTCLILSVNETKLRVDLTWSFGLCPGQAPDSCFGWWWGAGAQPKSERLSLFELLKDEQRGRGKDTVRIFQYSIREYKSCVEILDVERRKVKKHSHLCSFLLSVWERDCKVLWLVPFFSLAFWSCFMVPICSVLYSGAEEHSPRWFPRHRNLSISCYSQPISQLPSQSTECIWLCFFF